MTRRMIFGASCAIAFGIVAALGAWVAARGRHGLELPWMVDRNGIALVARRHLPRNQLLREQDLEIPKALPAPLRRFAADPKGVVGSYLVDEANAGVAVTLDRVRDVPRYAPKPNYLYVTLPIDAFTAKLITVGERIQIADMTGKVNSFCIEAIVPMKLAPPLNATPVLGGAPALAPAQSAAFGIVFAIPENTLAALSVYRGRIIFILGGKSCQ